PRRKVPQIPSTVCLPPIMAPLGKESGGFGRFRHQGGDREIVVRIGPDRAGIPTGAARERSEALDAVFVAVLGVDGLAGTEIETLAENAHLLPAQARKMHLDAAQLAIVKSVMLERARVEVSAELAIDPDQQVAIELRGDPLRVVVGGVERLRVLDEIDADDERRAAAQCGLGAAQESRHFVGLEVADGRSREKPEPRPGRYRR